MKFLRLAVVAALFFSGCAFTVRQPAFHAVPSAEKGKYRGVFHVHTEYSRDSRASLKKVVRTAEKAGLDFVVITDHNSRAGAEAYEKAGLPPRPLLVFGVEISAPDGHVIALGVSGPPVREGKSSQQLIDWVKAQGAYAVIAHPICDRNPWRDPGVRHYNGMEVYNFTHLFFSASDWMSMVSQVSFLYPAEFLKRFQKTPHDAFALWDRKMLEAREAGDAPVYAFGAIDAHIHNQWLGVTPESYMLFFQAVTTYVFAEGLEPAKIMRALGEGKSYVALEIHGSAQDFSFNASAGGKTYAAGESVPSGPVRLKVAAPRKAEIRLIHEGAEVAKTDAAELVYEAAAKGHYRAEVYDNGKLWIFSNPIYVEA